MNDCNTTGFIKFTHLLLGKMNNPGIANDVTFMNYDILHKGKDSKPKRELQTQSLHPDMETKLFLTKEGQSALIDAIEKQPYEVKHIETNQKSDFKVVDFDRISRYIK